MPGRIRHLVRDEREDKAGQRIDVRLHLIITPGVCGVFFADVLDGGEEEGRPVRGFGVGVGGDALVAPIGEEGAGLDGGSVAGCGEEAREVRGYIGKVWVRGGEGE